MPGSVAALGSLAGRLVLDLGVQGDVVIDVLAPGDQHEGDSVVVPLVTDVDVGGNQSWRWKRVTGLGAPRSRDSVGVVGGKEAVMSVHGRSPVRHVQVVAEAGDGPVPLHLALGGHEEGRAVVFDDGLGGVDQRESVGDGVLAESVLLGQVAGGLVDDGAQVADGGRVEVAAHGGQAHGALGLWKECQS